jgi:catechol-2,3-dioxygenase
MRGAEARPVFHAVDHVGITVSDPKKAAEFYGQLFGAIVYKEAMSEKRYVKVGPCYLSLTSSGSNQPTDIAWITSVRARNRATCPRSNAI